MGFAYLDGKNWEEITREERYYCLHLYNEIKGREKDFVNWLLGLDIEWNEEIEIDESGKKASFKKEWLLNSNVKDWEVGFEVCLYRDLIHYLNDDDLKRKMLTIKNPKGIFSPKRTFDLCLFSSNFMIIIEAKGYGGFDNDQMDVFKEDFDKLKELLRDKCPNIALIGLCRKKYTPKKETKENFHAIFRWTDLFNKYHNPVFERIEAPYNN